MKSLKNLSHRKHYRRVKSSIAGQIDPKGALFQTMKASSFTGLNFDDDAAVFKAVCKTEGDLVLNSTWVTKSVASNTRMAHLAQYPNHTMTYFQKE